MAVAALQAINNVNLFGARGGPSSVIILNFNIQLNAL
jgi:hypothetical protein